MKSAAVLGWIHASASKYLSSNSEPSSFQLSVLSVIPAVNFVGVNTIIRNCRARA